MIIFQKQSLGAKHSKARPRQVARPAILYNACVLCQDHFEDSQIFDASAPKKRLGQNAVPTIFKVPNPPPKVTPQRPLTKKKAFGITTALPTGSTKDNEILKNRSVVNTVTFQRIHAERIPC